MAALQCVIEKEYEKNTKIKPDDIELFRTWLNSQPHLPTDKITGEYCLHFFQRKYLNKGINKSVCDFKINTEV